MSIDAILIAQINANTQALNKLNEDARKNSELPALPVMDSNAVIHVEQGGVSYGVFASQFQPANSAFLEYIFNKQNSLAVDGTGVMYPTVDAVNEGLDAFAKVDKINFKDIYQTGLLRVDTDISVVSVSPADTLNITACDNILFVNEIAPDTPANQLDAFLKSFGNKSFVANAVNTNLAANTRGIFYVGLDKLGNQVYRTAKVFDLDICYFARIVVANTAGVYTIVLHKYIPDLANNRINNHDRFVISSGYIVPSGAASISFGNRGMSFYKNSINYANNKFDPNYLQITDSVNPTPMQFLFYLPNMTSLSISLATSTVLNPTQWYTAAGALGGTSVANTNYQVYKLYLSVTGTIIIQTKASTSNAPAAGVNAIFANRDDALAGLNSTVFPQLTPAGDYIALGTFLLRAGTPANGSQLNDPNDFYFQPFTSTASSSSVGVTAHDLLSGKNDNPAFQHVTTTDIGNWNAKANDTLVVHKALTETITGQKTFELPPYFRDGFNTSIFGYINLFNGKFGFYDGNGANVFNVKKDNFNFLNAGGFIATINNFNLTASRNYHLPNFDGTFAMLTDVTANDGLVLHKAGIETITNTKIFNPIANQNAIEVNLPLVTIPTGGGGVIDAISTTIKGHNIAGNNNLVSGHYVVIEGDKNAGVAIGYNNAGVAPTNSVAFDSNFPTGSTTNTHFRGRINGVTVFQVLDTGRVTAAAPIPSTTATDAIAKASYAGNNLSVNQSDTDFYPLIAGQNTLTGIGYINMPAFGWMRPNGDFATSGEAVVQISGDSTQISRWRFKADGSFSSPRSLKANAFVGWGDNIYNFNSGTYLGTANDFELAVILLHEISNGAAINRNSVNGTIEAYRGGIGSGIMAHIYNINTACSITNTLGNLTTLNTDPADRTLFTCLYGGKKYIAIRAIDVPAKSFLFRGDYQNSSNGEILKYVAYFNTSSSTVLNSEINNSLTVFNGTSDFSFNARINISTLKGVGTRAVAADANGNLIAGSGGAYLRYAAILSQSTTGAPIATVLENSIGSIVWSRTSTGIFAATLSGAFTLNKTFAQFQLRAFSSSLSPYTTLLHPTNTNTVNLSIINNSAYTDNFEGFIEIRVYQ